ncbi:unnamed protein product, partial [Phaeothamnion confervicola]
MSKKFLNRPPDVVDEMVEGVLLMNESRLTKLHDVNVLARSDYHSIRDQQAKVTVITGGGSGHEPAFAGYVGPGMLTAAVLGGVFASPSSAAVLAALRAVCGRRGCLVIVMNYTGDRLNFGMAVERARASGLDVRLVVVADDCALPRDKGITGRRGVAGTILVQKIACAAAEAGLSLEAVAAEAAAAAANVGTLGVALTCCTLPGQDPNDRLGPSTIEVGLGIHGEPGIRQTPLLPADALVVEMVDAVVGKPGGDCGGSDYGAYLALEAGQEVAVLVNNLGGTPLMELMVVARRAVRYLEERGAKAVRVYSGHMMTSLEMAGASVSIMRVDALALARLDAAVDVVAWPFGGGAGRRGAAADAPLSPLPAGAAEAAEPGTEPQATAVGGAGGSGGASAGDPAAAAAAIAAVAEALKAAEPELTRWDTVAGDGDCGITFMRGAEWLLNQAWLLLPPTDLAALLGALGSGLGAAMGGTSGAIIEIFFAAGQAAVRSAARSTSGASWAGAFVAGTEAVRFYGGADVGMRTMVDALAPAADILKERGPGGFEAAVEAAEAGAEATRGMEAKAGRANYVSV